jgi:muramoyltetrapeptide carboxypeptidase LdcA involved in peptidoglycan recycling
MINGRRLRAGDTVAAVTLSWGGPGETVFEVVHEETGLRELAIVTQMDFGHTDPMFVLPYGVVARIDPAAQTFEILESGVVD